MVNAEDRVVKGLGGVLLLGVLLVLGVGLAGGQAAAPGEVRASDLFILNAMADAALTQDEPTMQGGNWALVGGVNADGHAWTYRTTLLRSHLGSLPSNADIDSATLRLYGADCSASASVFAVTRTPGMQVRLRLPLLVKAHPRPGATPTPTPTATATPPDHLIFADDFNDGDMAGWTPHGGTWTNPGTFLRGAHEVYLGTAWNLRPESGTDFVYEGKVTLMSGDAAGLVFRSSADGQSSYCLVLDATANCLKPCINWPGWFFSSYPLTVEYGRAYTLRAELVGDLLRVYLDGVYAFTTTPGGYYGSGRFGVLVHNGVARFDDLAAWRLP